MAVNDISPAFVKLYYTVGNNTHQQVIPTKPFGVVTPGEVPSVMQYDGTGADILSALTAYVTLEKVFLNTSASFTFAEFWSKPLPTSDPLFIYQVPLGIAGTSAIAAVLSSQQTITFRSQFGGIYRNVLLDASINVNFRDDFPFSQAAATSLQSYLRGATSWIYARDGGKLIAPIRLLTKTNDRLRKRQLLNIS